MAFLCEHYGFPPNFWHAPGMSVATHDGRMGWREFMGYLHERSEALRRQAEGNRTTPGSWAGRDQDPWWDEQHRRARGV